MFNSIFSLGNLVGMYSGSPLLAAVSTVTYRVNGNSVPFDNSFSLFAPLLAILAPIFFFLVLIGVAIGVLMIVSWWKIFQKAGRPGWPAIIPIYNNVVMLQIVGMSPWLILLVLIPFVGQLALFVVMIIMNIKLAKAFGKDDGFAVGLILLPVVFAPILAFGQAKFTGIAPAAPVAPSSPVPPSNPVPPAGPTNTV
jgi:hypothetical protein